MKKYETEVLIYVAKFKTHLEKNPEASEYFLGNIKKSDTFFKKLSEIAQKNYENKGTPELTREQLENVKNELKLTNPSFSDFSLN